jgi:hypothetical protein
MLAVGSIYNNSKDEPGFRSVLLRKVRNINVFTFARCNERNQAFLMNSSEEKAAFYILVTNSTMLTEVSQNLAAKRLSAVIFFAFR